MNESIPVKLDVLIAAYRRGWTMTQIAFAAGVTHQAISLRIGLYQRRHGIIERIERPPPSRGVKILWHCANCGAPEWSLRIRLESGELHFCSKRCQANFARQISDEQVEEAILLRWEGNTWTHVAKLIGYPMQSIQMRIWKYLYATGQLTRSTVTSIWIGKHQSPSPSWKWLELATGIYCTESGAELGFRASGRSPWGRQIVQSLTPKGVDRRYAR